MVLLSVLFAFALSGWTGWSKAHAHVGAAQAVESMLRSTQQRAVTEGSSMCVDFNTTTSTWQLWRGACDSSTRVRLSGEAGGFEENVRISTAEFTYPDTTLDGVTFTPRGTATPGRVHLTRDGNDTVHTVTVEGLTGRVTTN